MAPSGDDQQYDAIAEFYDFTSTSRDRQDVGFYVEMAKQSAGPVLELGCGTGRVLVPIARAGIEIVGVDPSAHMLAVCRDKLSREPQVVQSRVRLVEGDMRRIALDRQFPLVTTPYRSFQHLLTVEEQLSCLNSIREHLTPEGRLVLDVFNPSLAMLVDERSFEERGDEPEFTMPDGRKVVRRFRTVARNLPEQSFRAEEVFCVAHPDGRHERVVQAYQVRYLFRFEAEHLLARVGFRLQEVYADYDKSPYGTKEPGELILVATRQ